jgi:phospholipid/cholesterol/gamma-HCH transport system substrate-binding protein
LSQVELDELMNALGGKAARGTQQILSELPEVLSDAEAPRQALRSVAEAAPTLGRAARALRGRRDGDLAELVRASARTARAIDAPTAPVRDVVEGAAETFQVMARRTEDLQRTLEVAPRVLQRADKTLTRLRSTLDVADPLLVRLSAAANAVEPTARRLRPLLIGGDRLLRDAEPAVRSLRPAVRDLAVTGRDGAPLLKELEPILSRLDQSILPALGVRDPDSRRTGAQMIGPLLSGITLGRFDTEGHYFTLGVNPGPGLGQQGALCQGFKTPDQLAMCESLVDLVTGQTGPRSKP